MPNDTQREQSVFPNGAPVLNAPIAWNSGGGWQEYGSAQPPSNYDYAGAANQGDATTTAEFNSILGLAGTGAGAGVGSSAATAPAYNFTGANTSTSSSGGSSVIWIMLVAAVGFGWFLIANHHHGKKSDDGGK